MRALDRKLLRDLVGVRAQIATIALVVACGVAAFTASLGTRDSLEATRERYYRESRFAEVFAHLVRAPEPVSDRLRLLDGVSEVETRLVFEVTVEPPDGRSAAIGRVVSLPPSGAPSLNRLHLRRGRTIDPARRDEVVVSEGFAAACRLRPGDRVAAVLNGRREEFRVVGVALSPETVFALAGDAPLPDDEGFGVLWVSRAALAAAFDMDGAFNDVVAALAPGASRDAVIEGIDRLLEPWGGLGAHGREEQSSHRFLSDEIAQQRTMATTIPPIFLGVSAFLLNVVLGRMVTAQREQIATLKAIGYGDGTLALHYLAMATIVVVAGAIVGTLAGAWFGAAMTAEYTRFFRFPVLEFHLGLATPLVAAATAFLAGATGAISALRRVARLAPAEAMRPPAPRGFRHGLLERLGLARGLSPRGRMLLRSISSRPLRFVLALAGIACSVGIVLLALCWRDALDHVIRVQFGLAERGDLQVAFRRPVAGRAVRELARVPGVADAEGYRVVAVRLRAGPRSYRTAVLGVPADARLRRMLDADLRPIEPPPDGLLLTRQLAERLRLAPGDTVQVEVREGERPVRDAVVAGLVDDFVGLSAYMEIGALHRLLREGDAVNAASLRAAGARTEAVRERLRGFGGVATVASRRSMREVFDRTTATFVLFFTGILTAFAVAIAVGIVHNTARVALQESSRELASLRVLGFTRGEVSALLLAELVLTLLLAIPFGLGLGYAAARAVSAAHQTETFRIPVVIEARTWALAALVVLAAGLVTALLVRRRVDGLDLVAVLKARE